MPKPLPSPCAIYRPDATGALALVANVVREPLIAKQYEPERVIYRLRVMCLQETGEEYCIGRACNSRHANEMIDAHLSGHPEHRSPWTERL